MKKTNEEKVKTATLAGFLGGLLIGGVAGAGVMTLLAPQSGKKTRRQMRRKGRKVRKQTISTMEDGMAQARTAAHDMSTNILEQTEALQQRGHEALDEGIEHITNVVDAGKSAVKGS